MYELTKAAFPLEQQIWVVAKSLHDLQSLKYLLSAL